MQHRSSRAVKPLASARGRHKLRELAAHCEDIREQERKRIARDIHDELGQNLLALKLDLLLMQDQGGPTLRAKVASALSNVDCSLRAVRNIINDLRPPVLELGLQAAVEWQVKRFERCSRIPCILEVDRWLGQRALPDKVTETLFRILQEALTNVARHAHASEVRIRLARLPRSLQMQVSDNGIGIQPGALGKQESFGLLGVRERVTALHGELALDSKPGHGTSVTVMLPLPAPAPAPH